MRFVELCCGSAALTLYQLGARRSLLPYQGSKWRFRAAIAAHMREAGLEQVTAVELYDPGPWGAVIPVVLDPAQRSQLIGRLQALALEDPREVYERTHLHPASSAPVDFASEYLFLQRLAYSGKAVGLRDGCWRSPGFNTSSAYGLPGTERFGTVNPMVPSLIRVLGSYELSAVPVSGERRPAAPPVGPANDTVVYFDPPYAGSTRYPNGDLDRDEVVALALAWSDAGAAVFVSEGEALPQLVERGWQSACLTSGRADTSPFRGKQAEWLTWSAKNPGSVRS